MKSNKYFGMRREKNKSNKKKTVIIVLVIIAVLIPSIIATVNYYLKRNNIDLTSDKTVTVSLYSNNKLLYEDKANPEFAPSTNLVVLVDSLLKNMSEVNILPKDAEKITPINAVVEKEDAKFKYDFYFSLENKSGYCIDANSKVFKFANNDASNFMESQYAQILYKDSVPPILYSTSDDAIIPDYIRWKYKNISGNYAEAVNMETQSEEIIYDMAGTLGIRFDNPPDKCSVKIYKSGIIIHEDTSTDLSMITVDPGTTLQLKVNAVWNVNDSKNYAGEISYNFKVLVRDRSEFILDRDKLNAGEFLTVSCTNILDINKIRFSSEPDIGFTPKFIESDDMVYALIPFNQNLEQGTYVLTFAYGATMQSQTVTLDKKANVIPEYNVTDSEKFNSYISKTSLDNFKSIIKNLDSGSTENIFLRNSFLDYTADGGKITFEYGNLFKSGEDNSYRSDGVQFELSGGKGATVSALNSGKVISSGNCEYLGNFVIIEHGLGLRTVYGHLSALNVKAGDIVVKGQSVGRTAEFGTPESEGVFIMCFVFDIAVDYSSIAGKTLSLYEPPVKDLEAIN